MGLVRLTTSLPCDDERRWNPGYLVDRKGIEPLTSTMRTWRSPAELPALVRPIGVIGDL